MKRKSLIGGSVSLLAGVVIAILALVRGKWQYPLLVCAVGAWALWLAAPKLVCIWHAKYPKEQPANFDRALAQTLLCHVNYRISACLQTGCPEAQWEWMIRDTARFVSQGGTGRIRVYGISDYNYANVRLDRNGRFSCSLVKLISLQDQAEKAEAPNQQPSDPKVWYDAQGRSILERLTADLESRGHRKVILKEDGSICIQSEKNAEEIVKGSFTTFPAKNLWPKLTGVLERAGMSAAVMDDHITVSW